MDGEEAKRTKGERRRARCSSSKAPGRISEGGGERKEPNSARTGNIESLKMGTESRGNHSLCSGLELQHPIMSKLWDLGGQIKRRKRRKKEPYIISLTVLTYSRNPTQPSPVWKINIPSTCKKPDYWAILNICYIFCSGIKGF